ncbi:MAG: sigma-54 dependent transcriptional regulator [Blastocatellia bacterium]|nr:sigma-54 dependent transcriptional regulator [Blastocatellia bacterium]MCX7751592.1 sigma-54 dependent transcriptional regulator [Blastocatellia bacterium]MDW8168692.1 sigma-54 dependent transcriptional regulator [Acidobacteriota bacterium]MDW8256958.1 sigma-54 dependent transcriptional regulator [Acidobacteriota bacterium]
MGRKGTILVIDDEEVMRDVLESLLSAEGYRVDVARTGEEGLEKFRERPYDLVLLDVSMPGMGGIATLQELLRVDPEAVVVIITAYATFETAMAAWQLGAFNCIRKPFQNDQILQIVEAGIRRRRKDEERRILSQTLRQGSALRQIIARSPKMRKVLDLVAQVAPTRSTVLIQGESGTGKELIARAIHFMSPRAETGQFVAVNCSNVSPELLESDLFGHVKGAFTGAIAAKKGRFEIADGGSIFLDEIGNISLDIQAKLLRVIQEREFTPVGDTTTRRVDVRIIAATNIDLKKAVSEGRFREDLFYRLNVITIHLPPLRERKEDILPLTQHFIRKFNAENNRNISTDLDPEVLRVLEEYPWPGNVRELENVIERAVIIARGDRITLDCLPDEILDPRAAEDFLHRLKTEDLVRDIPIAQGISFYDEVAKFEIRLIRRALELTGGNQSRAARLLGMNPTTLNSKIKAYNLNVK